MVRNFSYQNTMAIQAIHRSYADQLAEERATNLELRQQHFETQAGLRRVAALLREGIRWTEDSEDDDLVRSVMNAASAAAGRGGSTNITTGTNTVRRQVNSLHELSVLAELRHQNRALRRIIGLPAPDSDDEEDNDDSSAAVGEAGSMHSSVPARAAGPRHDEGALIGSAPQPPQQVVAEAVSATASFDAGTNSSSGGGGGESTTPGGAANSGTNDARPSASGSARAAPTNASTDTHASSDAGSSATDAVAPGVVITDGGDDGGSGSSDK